MNKLLVCNYEDRQNVIIALTKAGYKVLVTEEKEHPWSVLSRYYVHYEELVPTN